MSISSHKIYGPKGIGALYIRSILPRVKINSIVYGGGQERNIRSGTLNVPGIVGFAKAVEIAIDGMDAENVQYKKWTDKMFEKFTTVGGKLNGHYTNRLAHNLNIRFDGVQSKSIINTVSKKLAISAGSACTSDLVEPSHVLLALGLSEEQAHNCIRIGCNRYNTDEEIDFAIDEILNALESISKMRIS
jgi:cysteine desulfurase